MSDHPFTCRVTMTFLIAACLHTSLVQLAHAAGYAADHVNFLSLGGLKDWQCCHHVFSALYESAHGQMWGPGWWSRGQQIRAQPQ